MAPIRALVRPVPTDGLEDFKDLALPLDVQVLQHDADSETAHVSVPTEGAFSALQNLPGYTVTRLEEPQQQQQQQQQQTKQQPVAAASAAADSSAKTTTSASGVKRKVLPSSDVFYLITDMK
ncbi:hypothetical protein, conserved [Eimeria maxima]|uniref:Uncharacterized protein n=1 Tax=Eimeria maxima TaxID=5804 RepID=U6MBD1_EIMMA|nr:hypothetical protein, conserved [Eimeria maxima]CDJ61336.1 hypothetical protein, conserved [Eimeria maxima]